MANNKVLLVLGSDSDLPLIEDGVEFLKQMGIAFEVEVSSAHRNPEKTAKYAKEARDKGIEVIIAVAGMAAHLPGVIASYTTIPVIGVPIESGPLKGIDALLSIVQMPKGVPVATVGINAVKNAAILACEILSIKYDEVRKRLEGLREDMRRENKAVSTRLKDLLKRNEG